jgi:hypothetical protein
VQASVEGFGSAGAFISTDWERDVSWE